MKRVTCALPNASSSINGVAFEPAVGGGVTSAAIEDAIAKQFEGIPGYTVADVEGGQQTLAPPDGKQKAKRPPGDVDGQAPGG